MKILLIGDSGRLGTALRETLIDREHEVIGASRSHAEYPVDIGEPASINALYGRVGRVDAVACAAGHVIYRPISQISYDDYVASFTEKGLGQIELVRRGLASLTWCGSFTLISGALAREPIVMGTAGAMVNGAVEAFVRAAALEVAPIRVNAVSPGVFVKGLDGPGKKFAGFEPVPIRRVLQAYIRSIEQAETGRIYTLG